MAAVQIMIIDNIAVSGHTEYRIEVSFLGRTWVIQRRFSMFDKLHRKLHGDLPQMALPDIPPKKIFGRLRPSFIKQRQQQLQAFIETLLNHPQVTSNQTFRNFFQARRWMIGPVGPWWGRVGRGRGGRSVVDASRRAAGRLGDWATGQMLCVCARVCTVGEIRVAGGMTAVHKTCPDHTQMGVRMRIHTCTF